MLWVPRPVLTSQMSADNQSIRLCSCSPLNRRNAPPCRSWHCLTELGLQIAKSDQQLAALIPKRQPPAPEALAQGDHLGDFLEFRSGVETGLKPVVRNPAAQMMHMMQS